MVSLILILLFIGWSPGEKPVAGLQGTAIKDCHTGSYINYNFAYSIVIPKGAVGICSPPPMPQHGFIIHPSKEKDVYLWVDGSYNSLLWASLNEGAEYQISTLNKPVILKREPLRLDGLSAVHLLVRYQSSSRQPMVREVVIASRRSKREAEIIYEVGLDTTQERYRKDKVILDALVRTWRLKPLPRY